MSLLIYYILIGFVFGIINNFLVCNMQTKEEAMSENPSMIIFLILIILFWPFVIVSTIRLIILYFKNKKNDIRII